MPDTERLDAQVQWIVAPFDAASRYGGAANSLRSWRALLGQTDAEFLDRLDGESLATVLSGRLRKALGNRRVPIVLGGDHSLTFHCTKAIYAGVGPMTIIHFDAHHDAYDDQRLTHYSVFHHIKRRFEVDVIGLGHRFDADPLPPALTAPVVGPVYVSVDLDYFAPDVFSSVNHPVPCRPGAECSYETFAASLDLIAGPIVGFDFVEWLGSDANSSDYLFVQRLLARAQRALGQP